jgi:formylglycine-generating enzyme required for sulfatase activity
MLIVIPLFFINSYAQKNIKGFTYFDEERYNELPKSGVRLEIDSALYFDYSFYVKNTEVTIEEYFEFIKYVLDSNVREFLGKINPEKFLIKTANGKTKINWEVEFNYYEDEILKVLLDSNFIIDFGSIRQLGKSWGSGYINFAKIKYRNKNGEEITVIPNNYVFGVAWYNIAPDDLYYTFPSIIDSLEDYDGKRLVSIHERRSPSHYHLKVYAKQLELNAKKPITNINYYQAEAYCEWKQNELNKEDKKYSYTLTIPTEKEFLIAINSGFTRDKSHLTLSAFELYNILDSLVSKNKRLDNELYESSEKYRNNKDKRFRTGQYAGPHQITKEELLLDSYFNRFENSNDYFIYEDKLKKIDGLDGNLSEWVNKDMADYYLEYQFENNKYQFIGDSSKLIMGGNWYHGKCSYCRTYLSKSKQLETVGFRYVITRERK